MSVAVVVPFASDDPQRRRVWEVVRLMWPWPIVEGACDGPWSKAKAVADALTRTDADVLVIADADVWCAEVENAVDAVEFGAPWAVPHHFVRRLDQATTEAVLSYQSVTQRLTQPRYVGVEGGGITVIRRDVYEDCPLDPRFVGWGQEDEAWGLALRCLYGPPVRFRGDLTHFWHEPQPRLNRRTGSRESHALWDRYRRAGVNPKAMRALIAEHR